MGCERRRKGEGKEKRREGGTEREREKVQNLFKAHMNAVVLLYAKNTHYNMS